LSGEITTSRSRSLAAIAITAASLVAVGCGEARDTDKGFRPPVNRVIGVLLDGKATQLSPSSIGGGPVTLKIANKSLLPVRIVRLRSAFGSEGCVSAQAAAGPIPPGGTGTLQATLVQGTCEVSADGLKTATITVTGDRRSSQNNLLLP
jgi:hypothetical protein